MRGDATLTARLLLRGTGLAGLAAAAGGALAVVATTRPWYATVARVEMLGAVQARRVEALPGLPTVPWAWLAFLAGLVALGVGLGVAVDRPFSRSRLTLATSAVLLAVAGAGALVLPTELARLGGRQTRELLELSERLPTGVALELSAVTGVGVHLTLAAAALVAVGALGAREV